MATRCLVHLTDNRAAAALWRRGRLEEWRAFSADAEGAGAFAAYLGEIGPAPVYLLANVIEEDFRLELIPHLLGKSRAALIERKLNQAFRGTPYRQAVLQGREQEGRRDDRLLLSALSNPEQIRPWTEAILRCKAPLAGIYSVPLLTQSLLVGRLGLGDIPHLLLVTGQEGEGLRQSYFQQGFLKFSRLTPAPGESDAAAVNEESARIQQFLNNLRLLPREEKLAVVVLAPGRELPNLEAHCADAPLREFRFLDLEEVRRRLKLGPSGPGSGAGDLFVELLARSRLPNQYATAEDRWYWRLRQARLAMKSAGIGLVAAGAAVAALNLSEAFDLARQAEAKDREAALLENRCQATRSAFPATPGDAETLRQSVELADRIARAARDPGPLMSVLGQALEQAPGIRIDRLKWQTVGAESGDGGSSAPTPANPSQDAPPEIRGEPVEKLVIEGEVVPFSSYRAANGAVKDLAAALGETAGVEVSVLTLPLATAPRTALAGGTGAETPPQPRFSLELAYRPGTPGGRP